MLPLHTKIELVKLLSLPEDRRRPAQTQRLLEIEDEYKEAKKRRRGRNAGTIQTD
jgi:hypothetical protein